jgi:hypothetical protein
MRWRSRGAILEQLVADALDRIPERLARELDNVAITVMTGRSADQVGDLSEQGGTLLGSTSVARTCRSPASYNGAMPDVTTHLPGPIQLSATKLAGGPGDHDGDPRFAHHSASTTGSTSWGPEPPTGSGGGPFTMRP